jgi:hypothetical protein
MLSRVFYTRNICIRIHLSLKEVWLMPMNKMNLLLDKIERRLGTKPLAPVLPEDIKKDKWATEFIAKDTIPTFSRFFPHMVRIVIDADPSKKKDGWYIIDNNLVGGAEILGVKDIAWDVYGNNGLAQQSGIGMYDYLGAYNNYSMDDVMLLQARADLTSVFNNSIFVEFRYPNMVKLTSVTNGDVTGGLRQIPLDVFVNHPLNLMTIPPTQMETFERLATDDVANNLLGYLQHYDGLETIFANVDLKLSRLEQYANDRDECVRYLDDCHVNPANENQPIMYCV